jgi:hypothetical protein
VLPVPLLEVDYEETVADLDKVARQLIAWCGLDWEPGCLAFHENRRPVAYGRSRLVQAKREGISAALPGGIRPSLSSWTTWRAVRRANEMEATAGEFTAAALAKKDAEVIRLANKLTGTCTKCHDVFR